MRAPLSPLASALFLMAMVALAYSTYFTVIAFADGRIIYVDNKLASNCFTYNTSTRTCTGGSETAFQYTDSQMADIAIPDGTRTLPPGFAQPGMENITAPEPGAIQPEGVIEAVPDSYIVELEGNTFLKSEFHRSY